MKGDMRDVQEFSMELAGRTNSGCWRVATQANGAAFAALCDNNINHDSSDKPRDGIDFFPLSVEFEKIIFHWKDSGGFQQEERKGI